MNRKLKASLYPISKIAGFTEVDSTVLFYNFINSRLFEGAVVLDFGAGRGEAQEDRFVWRKKLASTSLIPVKRIAVDVDPAVMENPFATERHVMEIKDGGVTIPLAEASVDLVICHWVVEHLPDPKKVFTEFQRVLRPGGTVAIRTSNQWHYSYIVARLLGESALAEKALKMAQPGRQERDVFPKFYRANTGRALRRDLTFAGFDPVVTFTWDSEPAYVGNSMLGGLIGFVLHRLAMLGLLPRANLFGFAVKPETTTLQK